MLNPEIEEKIKEIIATECSDAFIIELALHRSQRSLLNVFLDTDEGIKLAECSRISRKIGRYLDENEVFDFAYILEVGSPGIGNPLKLIRQYHKNIGRNIRVTYLDGSKEDGKLIRVEEGDIWIEKLLKKKKKKSEEEENLEKQINFETIKEAKVLVSFN